MEYPNSLTMWEIKELELYLDRYRWHVMGIAEFMER